MGFKDYEVICKPVDVKDASHATQEAYKKVKSYFKNLPKFKVELLYSRKRIDKEQGHKTQSWVCGFVKKNSVMIVAPSVWTKITPHPKSDFRKVLCHELVHLAETWKTKHLPAQWLSEGLALYIAGQDLGSTKIKNLKRLIGLNNVRIWTNAANEGYRCYPYAAQIAKKLIKKYGFRKYLQLLKKTSQKQNGKAIEKAIKKVYGISVQEILQ